jgi:hypothetical protein
LAGLYRIQGHYSKAEPLYQRAVAIREKALRYLQQTQRKKPVKTRTSIPNTKPLGNSALPSNRIAASFRIKQSAWRKSSAHLLLQIRTRVLNWEWEGVFRRWYPDFRHQQPQSVAA